MLKKKCALVLKIVCFYKPALFIFFAGLIFLALAGKAEAASYYLRADGSAADKAAGSGPCSNAAAAMSVATHNTQTFSAGDIIYLCDDGGDISAKLIPPSSGSEGNPITYRPANGEVPILDVAGAQTVVIDSRKDYNTFEDLTVKNATVTNFYALAGTGVILTRIASVGGAIGIRYAGVGAITMTDCTATGGVGATAHGFYFSGGTVTLSGCNAANNTGNGFVWDATAGKTLISTASNCTASGNGINGFRAENAGTATTVTLTGSTASANSEDGFNTWDNATLNAVRCDSINNGSTDDVNSGDGFTAHQTSVMNLQSCIAYGNYKSGAAMTQSSSGEIINCTFYNNTEATNGGSWDGAGDIGIGLNGTGAWTIKNNITMGHPVEMMVSAAAVAGGITVVSDYNNFYDSLGGTAFDYNGNLYNFSDYLTNSGQDSHSINEDPSFVGAGGNNFTLNSGSPSIDAGTGVSLATDYTGTNLIYGLHDLGAYEYQPPYTEGSDAIPATGSVRIYSNGKYRALTASTTAETIAITDFSITPSGGSWYTASTSAYMDLSISAWNTSTSYTKSWTSASLADAIGQTHATTTIHTVGQFRPNASYTFKIDGLASTTAITGYGSTVCAEGACVSDSNGKVQFIYSGGYSTHTFSLEDTTAPTAPALSSPADSLTGDEARPALSWNASTDSESAIAKYQLYIDNALDSDNISNTSISITPTNNFSCGSRAWHIRAVDGNGNYANSSQRIYIRNCNTIPIYLLPSGGGSSGPSPAQANASASSATSTPAIPVKDIPVGQPDNSNNLDDSSGKDGKTESPLEKIIREAKEIFARAKNAISYFTSQGTETTKILGSGERFGVVNSFISAFGRDPKTQTDWEDVIKIANGRWPGQKNADTEANAKAAFQKIYQRAPDKNNTHDNNAIAVISYGLRPVNRNLNSEKQAIKFFKAIYGYAPKSASAWDIVRAIAYSGAKR